VRRRAVRRIGRSGFTYDTRQFLWSPADVRAWWPDMHEGSELEARLREEQPESFAHWHA